MAPLLVPLLFRSSKPAATWLIWASPNCFGSRLAHGRVESVRIGNDWLDSESSPKGAVGGRVRRPALLFGDLEF